MRKHKHIHSQLSCLSIPFLWLYQSNGHFDAVNSLVFFLVYIKNTMHSSFQDLQFFLIKYDFNYIVWL